MRLYEFEAKSVLATSGIPIPQFTLLTSSHELQEHVFSFPCVVKAQVLFGDRQKQNLVRIATNLDELMVAVGAILDVSPSVLIEQFVTHDKEIYVAFQYDTSTRGLVLTYALEGGSGIEDRHASLRSLPVPILDEKNKDTSWIPQKLPSDLIVKLLEICMHNDCSLLEINPLVSTHDGWVVLDAKMELDDIASFRHPEWSSYPERHIPGKKESFMEQKAKEINKIDTKGVAGASFFEFDGTIGILASGGGASLVAMDGMMSKGLKPANYTEYSGNPTRQKVFELSKLVLSMPQLEALWVVGGNANFTDIYETLSGVMDAIEQARLPSGFPIIVRRGGPRYEEAFESLKQRAKNLPIHMELYGPDFPMLETTGVLVKAVEHFRKQKKT